MKFALFVILASSVASTRINRSLLSKATRKLEDEEDDDYSILLGMSIKSMGCSAKYNIDPDEGAWVVQKQTYLRVCSEEDCATNSCDSSEYGSLVINTEDWVEWYAEWAEQYTESMCQNENYQYEVKYAAGEDVSAFEWSAECQEEYDPNYEEDEDAEKDEFELEEYAECEKLGWPYIKGYDGDGQAIEVDLYIGIGCVNNEHVIELWTDEDCTNRAEEELGMSSAVLHKLVQVDEDDGDDTEYESFNYFDYAIIKDSCISCTVTDNMEEAADEDYEAGNEVTELCAEAYASAVKCDHSENEKYPFMNGDTDNCAYIEQMVEVTYTGSSSEEIYSGGGGSATTISALFFSGTAAALAVYVAFLKKKVESSTINLGN